MMAAGVMQLEGREKGQPPRHWRARLLPRACRRSRPRSRLGFSPVRPFGLLLSRKHKGLCGFRLRSWWLSLQQQQKSDM